MTDNLHMEIFNELAQHQAWFLKLASFEASRITAAMQDHAIATLGCSRQDVDRVMGSQVDPIPKSDKDWKIFSVCLEFLHHERTKQ